MSEALKLATKKIKEITPDMIVPPKALQIPRQIIVDLDEPPKPKVKFVARTLKRNPLYTLTDLSTLPQSDKYGFLVNGLFGNEDHESITQVFLATKNKKT